MGVMAEQPIEWARLEREFEKRGMTASEIAVELGYARGYFAGRKSEKNTLPTAVIRMLDKLYDIRYDEYKPVEKEEVPVSEPPVIVQVQIDYDKLHDHIFDAVYQAMSKIFSE